MSWRNLLETDRYAPAFAYSAVPGALGRYDLPELLGFGPLRRVEIRNPVLADGSPADAFVSKQAFERLRHSYHSQGAGDQLKLSFP